MVNSVLMPLGLCVLAVLMLPLPAGVERIMVSCVDFLFNFRFNKNGWLRWLSTYGALTLCSCCMLLHQMWIQHKRYSFPPEPPAYATGSAQAHAQWELTQKSNRWRDERNLWMSFATALIYVVTNRLHSLRQELVSTREALAAATTKRE